MYTGVVVETFYDKVDCVERRKGRPYETNSRERLVHLVALGLVKASGPFLNVRPVDATPPANTGAFGELTKLPGGYYLLPMERRSKVKPQRKRLWQPYRKGSDSWC